MEVAFALMAGTMTEFPMAHTNMLLPGPGGALEAICDVPEGLPRAAGVIAVIAHPHPQHGGTMHNKVVTMLDRSLRELGAMTVRFNFRGVGQSEGKFDDGNGEVEDLLAVAQWAQKAQPEATLWLAGFSFGAYMAMRAVRLLPAKQLILVAPPVGNYPFAVLPNPTCPWLVIQGEEDEVVSAQAVFDWVAQLQDPPILIRMPQTGHFFHRKLMDLRGALKNTVRANLPYAKSAKE